MVFKDATKRIHRLQYMFALFIFTVSERCVYQIVIKSQIMSIVAISFCTGRLINDTLELKHMAAYNITA